MLRSWKKRQPGTRYEPIALSRHGLGERMPANGATKIFRIVDVKHGVLTSVDVLGNVTTFGGSLVQRLAVETSIRARPVGLRKLTNSWK
jgi:hypothetical protein